MQPEHRQAQRTEATRARLLGVARQLFTAQGFSAVSAEALVQQAGLTRGALYHHFGGKEGLFAALYEDIQREVTARIEVAAAQAPDAWSALRAGCHAFLNACVDPAIQRIMLLDAPVVLSWEHWRAVDAQYGLGALKAGLQAVMESGDIVVQPVDALAHLLVGAMNEAAMWIARADDPARALSQTTTAFDRLLEGLRMRPCGF